MSFCFGKLGICDSLYSSVYVSSLRDSSLTYTLSSHMPKKNSWFFSLSRFLLVITTEWQLPSSLHMELLTRILSNEANLMFSYSTGHLCHIPSLFFNHMRPAEISAPLFPGPQFSSLIMHFLGISQLVSLKAGFAQCSLKLLADCFSC